MRLLDLIDRAIARIVTCGQWLALPVVLLLFLQWPLRDGLKIWSREANDLGQWIFALYVAIGVTAATRAGTHLAADALARSYPLWVRRLLVRCGAVAALVPWGLFVLIGGKNLIVQSTLLLEPFPDTHNPGYFIIKLAMGLLAGLVLLQALVDIARPLRGRPE